MSQLFGPANQLGYVVRDIEAAMRHWTQAMHIGPFYYVSRVPIVALRYHGVESNPELSVAFAYSGDVQIELIQQHDDTASIYRAFVDAGYEGLHHIGFLSERFDRDLGRADEAGLQVAQSAVVGGPDGKETFFAPGGHAGTILKLIALHDGNRDLYRMVRTEAQRWDGSGPIRRIEL